MIPEHPSPGDAARPEQTPTRPSPRKALVVLGMHRSGTSALTRALNLAGSFLPTDVLPAVPGENDAGFWEPARLVQADKRALESAGVAWDEPDRIDPAWFASEQCKAIAADMARVFEEDFSGHELIVLKDPRLCRLVPLLRSALARCRIEPAFILILRHPASVAASLEARNGMAPGHAQMLWLRYVLDAERATRGLPRIVIGYDELLRNWKATFARVGKALDVTLAGDPVANAKITAFLEPGLMHHSERANGPLPEPVSVAWTSLCTLQSRGESGEVSDRLDSVARMLDEACALLRAGRPASADSAAPANVAPHPTPALSIVSVDTHSQVKPSGSVGRAGDIVATIIDGGPASAVAFGLFDAGYYSAANPDAGGMPLLHYLWRGRAEGRSPHPLFDPRHYARAAGIETLPPRRWFSHFVRTGETSGISPHPLVDLRRLARGYELDGPLRGLFARFARDREPPGNPHPLFDVRYYHGRYPDVAAHDINPLVHYLLHGETEGRQPSAWFDPAYYRSRVRNEIPRGMTALQHYVEIGGPAGISPTPRFDRESYVARHPEDARPGVDLLSACLDRYHGKVPEDFSARRAHAVTIAGAGNIAYWLRRRVALDRFAFPGFWTGHMPRIGFAVTQASDSASAGDYFTALELARELERSLPCSTTFLEMEAGNAYDADGLDVLIVMRDDYELDQLRFRAPHLITIGWARNWIDRWAERPWAQDYNAIWASSTKAAEYLSRHLARPVEIIPIATSETFLRDSVVDENLRSDYCFTGSYWNAERDISQWLKPDTLPFRFGLYGHGWENHPVFSRYTRGGLPYSRMKDVYAATRVVVDDANAVTKQWGSVNSRVYDALAAGALVITNGVEGSRTMFGELLPTYSSADELHALLTRYLTDEPARTALVDQLRKQVLDFHTYSNLSQKVALWLRGPAARQLRCAIKIGTPNQAVREEWGDFHFATGLRRALTRLGHSARIDCLDDWHRPDAGGDDVVIVLRGLAPYEPQGHQINLMWNISHPDKVADEEYERYDHIFIASARHARTLAARLRVPVTALLQCTDPELFHPEVPKRQRHDVLFVGNSRKVQRKIVRDALSAGLPLSVFGTRWEGLIPEHHLKGSHVPNRELAGYYASAGVVLNDHWDDMREHGLLSNRLFDAAACGARIVTDPIEGLGEVFGDLVQTYETASELSTVVDRLLKEPAAEREKRLSLARQIMRDHSFDARAKSILAVVEQQTQLRTVLLPGE